MFSYSNNRKPITTPVLGEHFDDEDEKGDTLEDDKSIPQFEMEYFDIEREFTECIKNVNENERKYIASMILKILKERKEQNELNDVEINLEQVENWINGTEFISGKKNQKSKRENRERRENVVKLYTMLFLMCSGFVCVDWKTILSITINPYHSLGVSNDIIKGKNVNLKEEVLYPATIILNEKFCYFEVMHDKNMTVVDGTDEECEELQSILDEYHKTDKIKKLFDLYSKVRTERNIPIHADTSHGIKKRYDFELKFSNKNDNYVWKQVKMYLSDPTLVILNQAEQTNVFNVWNDITTIFETLKSISKKGFREGITELQRLTLFQFYIYIFILKMNDLIDGFQYINEKIYKKHKSTFLFFTGGLTSTALWEFVKSPNNFIQGFLHYNIIPIYGLSSKMMYFLPLFVFNITYAIVDKIIPGKRFWNHGVADAISNNLVFTMVSEWSSIVSGNTIHAKYQIPIIRSFTEFMQNQFRTTKNMFQNIIVLPKLKFSTNKFKLKQERKKSSRSKSPSKRRGKSKSPKNKEKIKKLLQKIEKLQSEEDKEDDK